MLEHGRCNDHVATVIEGHGNCGPAASAWTQQRIGAAAALHRPYRNRAAGGKRCDVVADEFEVAHAVEVVIRRHTGRAIAESELGAQIQLDPGGTVTAAASIGFAPSPLIRGKWPARLGP